MKKKVEKKTRSAPARTHTHTRLIFAPFKHPPLNKAVCENMKKTEMLPERRKTESEKPDVHKVGCSSKKNKSSHVCSLPGSKDIFDSLRGSLD